MNTSLPRAQRKEQQKQRKATIMLIDDCMGSPFYRVRLAICIKSFLDYVQGVIGKKEFSTSNDIEKYSLWAEAVLHKENVNPNHKDLHAKIENNLKTSCHNVIEALETLSKIISLSEQVSDYLTYYPLFHAVNEEIQAISAYRAWIYLTYQKPPALQNIIEGIEILNRLITALKALNKIKDQENSVFNLSNRDTKESHLIDLGPFSDTFLSFTSIPSSLQTGESSSRLSF